MIFNFIIQAIITVASMAYQRKQQKKQKEAMDKMKGVELTLEGQARSLPVVYGYQSLGGVRLDPRTANSFTYAAPDALGSSLQQGMGASLTGKKNEFLFQQTAFCHGPISGFVDVTVDDLNYNYDKFSHGQTLHLYPTGSVADPMATANGFANTRTFTNTAYISGAYRINRDEPQYNGTPSLLAFVKGRTIKTIVDGGGGSYSVSASESFSNNPAYCLLDYLTNNNYGASVALSEIDLESFYEVAKVCDVVVESGKQYTGKVHGGDSTGDVKRYYCDIVIDTEQAIRDNVELILNTMGDAQLVWNGTYYLRHPATENSGSLTYPVDVALTDEDIVRDTFNIAFATSNQRLNQVTVTFRNAFEDFETDSYTWPDVGSSEYVTYLSEDSNMPLVQQVTLDGVTMPYHAQEYAQELVKTSRDGVFYEFVVGRVGVKLEPNDIISVDYPDAGVNGDIVVVKEVQTLPNLGAKVVVEKFDSSLRAWSTKANAPVRVYPTYDFTVPPASSLLYTQGSDPSDKRSLGRLDWTEADYDNETYVVDYLEGALWVRLGETRQNHLLLYKVPEWSDGETVDFRVRTRSNLGDLSTAITTSGVVKVKPETPTALSVSEEIYNTNTASGIRTRASVSWTPGTNGVAVDHYRVEGYNSADGLPYINFGTTSESLLPIADISDGLWNFKVTAVSVNGEESASLTDTYTVLGLNATPADPTGFSGAVDYGGIILTWNEPTDLDVLSGGYAEIRYSRSIDALPVWELSTSILGRVSGSTTSATVPVAQGYYLIKFFDSSGNESDNAATFRSAFVGPTFNFIDEFDEAPAFLGSKTNCSVVGSNLELDSGQTTLEYVFDNILDLGVITDIRVKPDYAAFVTDPTVLVSDYNPVSGVARFSGPYVDSSILFEARITDDDPNGTPTWSTWEPLVVGAYQTRGIQVKATGIVADTAHTMEISSLSLEADKDDLIQSGTSTSSASSDVTVTFDNSFYPGVGGLSKPSVNINVISGANSETVVISSRDKDGFSFSVYDSGGSRIARDIDWQAVGQ